MTPTTQGAIVIVVGRELELSDPATARALATGDDGRRARRARVPFRMSP